MNGPQTTLIINNVNYPFPLKGASDWAEAVSTWAIAASNGLLQKSGGLFTLTSDANFGSGFGLIAKYFKSISTNISQTGVLRLANADAITWRNSSNSSDHSLTVDSNDRLTFNGVRLSNTVQQSVAAAGTTQGTATAITASYTEVTSASGSANGLILPAINLCDRYVVFNRTATTLKVYPTGTQQINSAGASLPYSIPPSTTVVFYAANNSSYYT